MAAGTQLSPGALDTREYDMHMQSLNRQAGHVMKYVVARESHVFYSSR